MATKKLISIKDAKSTNAQKSYTFGNPATFKLGKIEDETTIVAEATDKVEVYEVENYLGEKEEAIRVYTKEGYKVRINNPEILDKLEVGTKLNCVKYSWIPDPKVNRSVPYLFLDGVATA